jgi:nucleotide-binding universal stress UspA family protein
MKLLLPTDGSEASQLTLQWATQLFAPQTTEIYLLCVVPKRVDAFVQEESVEKARRVLDHEKAMLAQRGMNVVDTTCVLGNPAEVICDYANNTGIDQILIGSHGKTRLAKFIMGSVSKGVLQCAAQPVLLLNNLSGSVFERGLKMQKTTEGRRVLLPVDGSDGCWQTLRWAVRFLDADTHDIHLLHAYSYSPEGGYRYPEFSESDQALTQAEAFFRDHGFKTTTQCLVGSPITASCNYADEHDIDEIIIGSHGDQGIEKVLMGSVTQGILKCSNRPVLVINNTQDSYVQSDDAGVANAATKQDSMGLKTNENFTAG